MLNNGAINTISINVLGGINPFFIPGTPTPLIEPSPDSKILIVGTITTPTLPPIQIPLSSVTGKIGGYYYEEFEAICPDLLGSGANILLYSQDIENKLTVEQVEQKTDGTTLTQQLFSSRMSAIKPNVLINSTELVIECSETIMAGTRPYPYERRLLTIANIISHTVDSFGRSKLVIPFTPQLRTQDEILYNGGQKARIFEGNINLQVKHRTLSIRVFNADLFTDINNVPTNLI